MSETILVTGAAGFVGFHTVLALLGRGYRVVGVDNLNDYYDVSLKQDRLNQIPADANFTFVKADVADGAAIKAIFAEHQPSRVVHLAAQAGVRYSLENPDVYIQSNLVGFGHILEGCRHGKVAHLVYASSSSVYGANTKMPFSEHDGTDHPVSLYAATKKANEAMAHAYSQLYKLPTTGLRFFTVYGPWGRPDMAPILFANAIAKGEPIKVFNEGKMKRDFTYVDDIVQGVADAMEKIPSGDPNWDSTNPDPATSLAPYRLYNIGNNEPVELLRFIELMEKHMGRTTEKQLLPMQKGDVVATYASVDDLAEATGFRPSTPIEEGVRRFVDWYKAYYNVAF